MNNKELVLLQRVNEAREGLIAAIKAGTEDRLQWHSHLEELRLASQFIVGSLKQRMSGMSDKVVIESGMDANGYFHQVAPQSVRTVLNFTDNETWYVEFDESGTNITVGFQPVSWFRVDGGLEAWGSGNSDPVKQAAVEKLALERIEATQSLSFVRWSTLGAMRRAYKVCRKGYGK